MLFQEPTAEFVDIEINDIITFSCNETTSSTSPSGEDCLNCDANMNNCSDYLHATQPIVKIESWVDPPDDD